jgi:hypothetical protein
MCANPGLEPAVDGCFAPVESACSFGGTSFQG